MIGIAEEPRVHALPAANLVAGSHAARPRGSARLSPSDAMSPLAAARKVFLRACATLDPQHWDGQETMLRAVDGQAWVLVRDFAVQHGLLGLVARNLEWAHRRTGLPIPILDRARAWRHGQLLQMLVQRKAARRVAEALSRRGIRFVVFKGMALVEQVYGDLSLRAFCDCDILVDREQLEAAHAVVQRLGYSLADGTGLQDCLIQEKSGANLWHRDGFSVDLHWAIRGYEMPPVDPQLIWRHCRPPQPSQDLPGWRMSPALTLINLASHFQVHEYEEIKPLVDFYLAAVRLGPHISAEALLQTARALGMAQNVELAARLCERLFIHNPLVARLAAGSPSIHARLALRMLREESLLRREKMLPTMRRLRGLICHGSPSSSARAFRRMLVPKTRELELRFGRPFHLAMYPKYYLAQTHRVFARSRIPLSDQLLAADGSS